MHVPSSYDLYIHGVAGGGVKGGVDVLSGTTCILAILRLLKDLRPELPVMKAEVHDLTSCVVVRTAPGLQMRERKQGLSGKAVARGR